MLRYFKGQKRRKKEARALYEKAVERGRNPLFYEKYGVPDTLDGRYELILMHVFVIMNRLKGTKEGDKLAQKLFDIMFKDMERSLREMGIGDLSVPKHMKRMMNGFNGRVINYGEALEGKKDLSDVVRRNLYGTVDQIDQDMVTIIVRYLKKAVHNMDMMSERELCLVSELYPEL